MSTASAMVIQTPSGSGKKWRGSSMSMRLLIGERGALTVWFPASHLAVPRAIPIMPRVTMKGIMRKTAMMRPLINPITPATAMVRAMAAPGPKPRTSEVAPTTPARATTEPTLKSMPPLTMIMVMPSAPMATITVCSRMILQLVPVKKVSRTVGLRENRPITSASPNTGPMALTSRQALRRSILEERVMRGSDIWVQGGFGLPDGGRHQGVFGPVGGRADGGEHSAAHHADGVANAKEFGQVRTDKDDRPALRRQPAEQLVDLHLAAHVDAPGGFVQQKDPGLVMQQPAHGDLLLVAPGQLADRLARTLSPHIQTLHPVPGALSLPPIAHQSEARKRPVAGDGQVVRQGAREQQAFLLAVFTQQTDPLRQAPRRRTARALARTDQDLAFRDTVQPKTGPQRFSAPRADQSGDAEDFALAQGQSHGSRFGRAAEGAKFQHRTAR